MNIARHWAATLIIASLAGCERGHPVAAPADATPTRFGAVDERRLAGAQQEPDEWFTTGRDAHSGYYSPLADINAQNLARLGFAWNYDTGSKRGLEATPVVVDGVLYTSGNWGRVYALDAASGRELWTYDPGVPGQWGRYGCCDVVNRGIALSQGLLYVGTLDGYIDALDAKTGKRQWRSDTLPGRGPKDFHYFITGTPVVAGDLLVIGNGGGDFSGARGFVTAIDRRSGTFRWRFYTVPRDPKLGPQDQPHLTSALATWDKDYHWETGGGGSVWDGLSYDPALKLIYFGTGNPSPYQVVNLKGASHDELYAGSILAVHADSGALAWFYQAVPGDGWDYDATAKLVLTDLMIEGRRRSVLLQASKNGFVYLLDRATGEFLSAAPFSYVNWTAGLDPKTHRPIPSADADWSVKPKLVYPSAPGAHSWHPMSYSPKSGLLYIPVIDAPMIYVNTEHRRAGLIEGNFDLAFFLPEDYDPEGLKSLFGPLPPLTALSGAKQPQSRGLLRAFDPVAGKAVWEAAGSSVWDGGVLSTGGDLVFRGDAEGFLNAYDASSGRLLKRIEVGTSIMAAPMTYRVRGEQYIALMAGFGGGVLYSPFPKNSAAYRSGNAGRIVALKLDGGAVPKPAALPEEAAPEPPARQGSAAQIAQGEVLYSRFCSRCHAFGRALLPDLRRMSANTHQIFYGIVLEGFYQPKGMGRFDDVLTRAEAESLHAYLIDQAWRLRSESTKTR